MHARTIAAAALALMLAGAACAAPADPMRSPECEAARVALDHAADDASRKVPGAKEQLAKARKQVLDECLGRDTGERVRSGAPDPPIAVAPPVMQAPRALPAPSVAPPPAPAYTPPPVVTTCDTAGCWDSNGRRINNLGPMVVGPRGPCTAVAGTVQCP